MEIASYLEHTLLRPDASPEQIKQLCQEALDFGFKGVCIPPYYVGQAVQWLENKAPKIITVVGFPMGYATIAAKVEEVKRAVDEGADEIDVVANLAAIKDKRWSYVYNDIDSVTRATHLKGRTIKIILEMGLLNQEELQKLCKICGETGVDFVKTCTGFNNQVANLDMIRQLKQYLPQTKIKASGGIKTLEQAQQFIQAGAKRIGTSASLAMIKNHNPK